MGIEWNMGGWISFTSPLTQTQTQTHTKILEGSHICLPKHGVEPSRAHAQLTKFDSQRVSAESAG